jgi:RND family efflux transporter MFP subunit
MKSLRFSHALLLFLAAVLLCVLALALPVSRAAEEKTAAPAKAALTVSTVLASSAEWPQYITASGSIAAWHEALVGSEAGGLRLTEVRVNVGDPVRKGQELARLQSETVGAEREQTRASIAEAEAAFAEAQANANRARQIEASGALSAQQIAQYLTAELTARARVDVLKARLKSDDLRLSQTRILAPDDGTISARAATLGAVVQPGQELFRLIRRDRLEWRAEMPAVDLARIKPGLAVSITTAGKGKLAGRVRMVGPTLDPQTRNGLVYVDLDSKGGGASAGMFASGEIEVSRSKVLALPQSAVLLRDGFSYVFRVGPDNRVIQTKVSVGQRSGDLIAIIGGLESGMAVASNGVGFLADGDLVRVLAASVK